VKTLSKKLNFLTRKHTEPFQSSGG